MAVIWNFSTHLIKPNFQVALFHWNCTTVSLETRNLFVFKSGFNIIQQLATAWRLSLCIISHILLYCSPLHCFRKLDPCSSNCSISNPTHTPLYATSHVVERVYRTVNYLKNNRWLKGKLPSYCRSKVLTKVLGQKLSMTRKTFEPRQINPGVTYLDWKWYHLGDWSPRKDNNSPS